MLKCKLILTLDQIYIELLWFQNMGEFIWIRLFFSCKI